MSALHGIRIVELAREPIALAGKLLADMGADLILVEPPEGCPARRYPPFLDDEPGPDRSLWWWHHHSSKRGVCLDLEGEEGRTRFRELIAGADMLIEAEPAGRLAALGIDWPELSALNPGLIHVSLTPFGRTSANAAVPTTDLTLMAGAGPVWSCGYDDRSLPPVRGGSGGHGWYTGCHYAVMAALTAYIHRLDGGPGQFIDVSAHQANNVSTEGGSYNWMVAGQEVQRQTGRHAYVVPTGETQVLCRDGRWVNSGVPPRTPAEFQRLLDWVRELGLEEAFPEAVFLEMGADPATTPSIADVGVTDEATAIFGAGRDALMLIARSMDAYDFFIGCQDRAIAAGMIYSPDEAYEDPQIRARGFQVEVAHPELGRSFRYPGAPYLLPASPWRISRRAPLLGEHQGEIFGS